MVQSRPFALTQEVLRLWGVCVRDARSTLLDTTVVCARSGNLCVECFTKGFSVLHGPARRRRGSLGPDLNSVSTKIEST